MRDPGARRRHHLQRAGQLSRAGLRRAGRALFRPAGATEARLEALERHRRPRARTGRRSDDRHRRQIYDMLDSYKSLAEALAHGGIANNVRVKIDWIDSRDVREPTTPVQQLESVNGILVPGGFGERGTEGKIRAARFARERKVPYLRHLLRHADGGDRGGAASGRLAARRPPANSVRPIEPVVGLMTEWVSGNQLEKRNAGRRSRRHDAARRLSLRSAERQQGARDLRQRSTSASATAIATKSTSTTARSWKKPGLRSPACRRTGAAGNRRDAATIRGSSACSSIPS